MWMSMYLTTYSWCCSKTQQTTILHQRGSCLMYSACQKPLWITCQGLYRLFIIPHFLVIWAWVTYSMRTLDSCFTIPAAHVSEYIKTFIILFNIQRRGVVMLACAQALKSLFGKSVCLLRTCEKKVSNLASLTSPRCSWVEVTAQ